MASVPIESRLATCLIEIRCFGVKFYEPDALPNITQWKYTLNLTFSASAPPEGE